MNFGRCPNCGFKFEIKPDQLDATYTKACRMCSERFSYRIVDGKSKRWVAPRVAGIQIRNKRTGNITTTYDDNGVPILE